MQDADDQMRELVAELDQLGREALEEYKRLVAEGRERLKAEKEEPLPF